MRKGSKENKKQNKPEKEKKFKYGKQLKMFGIFFIFELIFIPLLSFILIYHGPFKNTKEMIVTTAMATMRHQYFATWFLSQEEIDAILAKNKPQEDLALQEVNDVQIAATTNDKGTEGIELVDVSTDSFKGYLLVVKDPSRVKLMSAPKLGKVGATLSQIVEYNDAIGGINAGGFADDVTGTGGKPSGIIIQESKLLYSDQKSSYSIVGLDSSNRLIVSNSMSYSQMKKQGMVSAVSFGPTIIVNGVGAIKSGNGGLGIHPRTAIGQRKDGAILMLVIDGRQKDSIGATLKNVQDILLKYGAYNAFNLDGGASSTMVYNNKLINKPSDATGERYIPTAFIITK